MTAEGADEKARRPLGTTGFESSNDEAC